MAQRFTVSCPFLFLSHVLLCLAVQWPMKKVVSSPFNTAKNGTARTGHGVNKVPSVPVVMTTTPAPPTRNRQQYPASQYGGAPGQHHHHPTGSYGGAPHQGRNNPGGGNFQHTPPAPGPGPMPAHHGGGYGGQQGNHGNGATNPYYADHYGPPLGGPGPGAGHFGGSQGGGQYNPGYGGGQNSYNGPSGYRSPMPFDPNAPNVSYYVFSQVWPNGHCMTATRSPCQNLNYEADVWTIRGLWPAVARSDRHISFCRGAALRPLAAKGEAGKGSNGSKAGKAVKSSKAVKGSKAVKSSKAVKGSKAVKAGKGSKGGLKSQFQHGYPATSPGRSLNLIDAPTMMELERVWPNLDFSPNPQQEWQREYRRHGVCSPFETGVYFHTAIDLHSRYNIFRLFEEAQIYPDDLYTYRAPELHQALIDSLGYRCALYCKRKQIRDGVQTVWVNVLYEVRVCLDTDLMPMNCPAFDVRSDLDVLYGKPVPCYNDVLYPNYHYADSQPHTDPAQRQGGVPHGGKPHVNATAGHPQMPMIQVQPIIQLPTTYMLPDGRMVQTQPLVPGNPKAGSQIVVVPVKEKAGPTDRRGTALADIISQPSQVGSSIVQGGGSHREVRIKHPDVPGQIIVHVPKNTRARASAKTSQGAALRRTPVLPVDSYHAPSSDGKSVQYPAQRPYPAQYAGAQDATIPLDSVYYHGQQAQIQLPADIAVLPKSTTPQIIQQPIKKKKKTSTGFAPLRKPGAPPSAAVHQKQSDAPAGVLPRPRPNHPMQDKARSKSKRTQQKVVAAIPVAVVAPAGPAAPDAVAGDTGVVNQPEYHIYINPQSAPTDSGAGNQTASDPTGTPTSGTPLI